MRFGLIQRRFSLNPTTTTAPSKRPPHPMYCSDRCVVSALDHVLDLAAPFPSSQVGMVIDTYHLWWDPDVWTGIARAGAQGHVALFQVADRVTPLPEGVLTGRGMLGDGCVGLRRFRRPLDAAGYTAPVEAEIFTAEPWATPGPSALELTPSRFGEHVA